MTIWAGIDIGNATTEVVLCKGRTGLEVLASGRTPTRGGKGSPRAVRGAAQLARRLADGEGVAIGRAAFAPTRPVHSVVERVQLQTQPTGRLTIASRSAATAAGDAAGVGVPVAVEHLDSADHDHPLVACATREWSFHEVANRVNAAVDDGRNVVAVVTANDEAVLILNRLRTRLPVIDDVDVRPLLSAALVAVEVRHGAGPLRRLTDPFWLADVFGLHGDERADARIVADELFDSACAAVYVDTEVPPRDASLLHPLTLTSSSSDRAELVHVVHLADVAARANSRRGSVSVDCVVRASIDSVRERPADADELGDALGVAVTRIDSEAAAARAGAITTPGVTSEVVVVDVGGGTVDVVTDESRNVLPGAGQLLTAATAAALDISASAAEYAKRAEALTAITAQLVEDEHGRRHFLDRPIGGRCTGWLLTTAPSGLLPFTSQLSGSEWRNWRLAAKRLVIGGNVQRGLEQVAPDAAGVLLVGGGASDDELVRAVSERLGHRVTVGRGNVGGALGHRFAVAYGLVVLAAIDPQT